MSGVRGTGGQHLHKAQQQIDLGIEPETFSLAVAYANRWTRESGGILNLIKFITCVLKGNEFGAKYIKIVYMHLCEQRTFRTFLVKHLGYLVVFSCSFLRGQIIGFVVFSLTKNDVRILPFIEKRGR